MDAFGLGITQLAAAEAAPLHPGADRLTRAFSRESGRRYQRRASTRHTRKTRQPAFTRMPLNFWKEEAHAPCAV